MSAPVPSNRAIAITIDGYTHSYHLRSLLDTSDDGIREWAEFCALVFSYKPNPPRASYFLRHYRNDPRRDPALVRVLRTGDGGDAGARAWEIVSSVRVFRRSLSTGGGAEGDAATPARIEAGGLGEVCTHPNHQRRGLSKILLKDALATMPTYRGDGGEAEGRAMSCSLLHASPDFRPFYSKAGGYRSVRSEWSVVPVLLQDLSNARSSNEGSDVIYGSWCIRQAKFPEDAIPLQRLHEKYSERRLVTIVRSMQYWRDYISAEVEEKKMWVLTKQSSRNCVEDKRNSVLGWICLRKRGERYQLCDFGVDITATSNMSSSSWAMERLLGVALEDAGVDMHSDDEVLLLLPTFVLSQILKDTLNKDADPALPLDITKITEEHDDGWMYLNFDESKPNVLELTTRQKDPVPHLIWPIDSF